MSAWLHTFACMWGMPVRPRSWQRTPIQFFNMNSSKMQALVLHCFKQLASLLQPHHGMDVDVHTDEDACCIAIATRCLNI